MTPRITASQAKSIAYYQHNKTKEYVIQENLDKIYSYISDAAQKGSYHVELHYPNYGDEISHKLREDGYKVKKTATNYFRNPEEFIVISWENV
jgi:hypothetical protein